jgi:hypothetical protein
LYRFIKVEKIKIILTQYKSIPSPWLNNALTIEGNCSWEATMTFSDKPLFPHIFILIFSRCI